MPLSDTSRIDLVGENPKGEIVLVITAPEPWGSGSGSFEQLTGKLCTYLSYLHSDEYRASYGSKPASIQLLSVHEPPERIRTLLERTAEAARIQIDIERGPVWGKAGGGALPDHAPDLLQVLRAQQATSRTPDPRSPVSPTRAIQSGFGLLGLVVALGAAIYTYLRSSSFSLAFYVALLANYLISRGVADVITDDFKLRRALYFAFLPGFSTGFLYLAYRQWDRMWLAVALGLAGGWILHAILAPAFFPRIHREEVEDSMERVREVLEKKGKTGT